MSDQRGDEPRPANDTQIEQMSAPRRPSDRGGYGGQTGPGGQPGQGGPGTDPRMPATRPLGCGSWLLFMAAMFLINYLIVNLFFPAPTAPVEIPYNVFRQQAEAGNVEEAPQIATVIYNRLSQGMPLGIDAVDRYGAELAGTSVVFNDASLPYNTRRRAGLPPTPISAPGDFAIAAALQPASGPWMYYVLESERQHVFVVTDSEFQAAKRACIERNLGCG